MNFDEIYNAWKGKKRQIDINESFSDEVMNQVYQYEKGKTKQVFNLQWLIDLISVHPLAQAALVMAGAVTGFIRLVLMILVILSKGDING